MWNSCSRVWHSKGSRFAGTVLYSPRTSCASLIIDINYRSLIINRLSEPKLAAEYIQTKTIRRHGLNVQKCLPSRIHTCTYDTVIQEMSGLKCNTMWRSPSTRVSNFNNRWRALQLSCAVTLRSRAESLRKWRLPWWGEGHKKAHLSRLKDK